MNKQEYNAIIEALTEHRKGVSDSKREDYTKGSDDVFANFKNVAENVGLTPLQVWLVYTNKHWDAICNYIQTEGQSESEPIKERFGDLLNYLELGWGLISENRDNFFDVEEEWNKPGELINCKEINQNKEHHQINCTFPRCGCSTNRSTGI